MRTIDIQDPSIASITVVAEVEDLDDDNIDVWVALKDGRSFGFTVFTLRNVDRLMDDAACFVSPGMLLVRRLTDEAILAAVRDAVELGIEQLGVLHR